MKHRVDIFFEKINKYMFATALRTLNSQMKLRENMVITSEALHGVTRKIKLALA